jgi:hypothetical protein
LAPARVSFQTLANSFPLFCLGAGKNWLILMLHFDKICLGFACFRY